MLESVNESAGTVLRWCRALLLATVALGAGVAAHLGADGLMPGRRDLAILFLVCAAGAAAFLGRPASRLRVVLLLVSGQTFIHGGLTALAGHRGDPPLARVPAAAPVAPDFRTTPGVGGRVGSLMDQFYAGQPGLASGERVQLAVPYPVQHLLADLTGAHALMAVCHLAAAVVVGLWLAMGERALWTLLTLAGELVVRTFEPLLRRLGAAGVTQLVCTAMRDALRRVVPSRRVLLPAWQRALSRTSVLRGPPRSSAFSAFSAC
jgi:hypothetical protein